MAQVGTRGERLDLIVRQGATLGPHTVTITNPDGSAVNLTGCTIHGQVRKDPLDTGTPVASFVINYVDPVAGKYSFEISHTVTAAIPAGEFQNSSESMYQYDMELVDSQNRIIPLHYGDFINFREVTRV